MDDQAVNINEHLRLLHKEGKKRNDEVELRNHQ